jgi:hypothetical protein
MQGSGPGANDFRQEAGPAQSQGAAARRRERLPRNEMAAREAPRGQRISPSRSGGGRYRRADCTGKSANSTVVSLPASTLTRLLALTVRPSRRTSAFSV